MSYDHVMRVLACDRILDCSWNIEHWLFAFPLRDGRASKHVFGACRLSRLCFGARLIKGTSVAMGGSWNTKLQLAARSSLVSLFVTRQRQGQWVSAENGQEPLNYVAESIRLGMKWFGGNVLSLL